MKTQGLNGVFWEMQVSGKGDKALKKGRLINLNIGYLKRRKKDGKMKVYP
jgi:hypothetical protein